MKDLCRLLAFFLSASLVPTASGAPGDADAGFNPVFGAALIPEVTAVAVQPDGKIIAGGIFGTVNGTTRTYLARLNANGTLDASFAGQTNGEVNCVAVQPDGKIVIGGLFSAVNGVARGCVARLHADGTLDTAFNPDANLTLRAVALQADNRIIIGGSFTTVGGVARSRIARLNADGSLDTSFNPGADDIVKTLVLQPDGKVLVGGQFGVLAGVSRNHIGQLNADGTLDSSFNPNSDGPVECIALLADGKILVGGLFNTMDGSSRADLARLNADGSLDSSFTPTPNNRITSIVVQADGKALIAGDFTSINGTNLWNVVRLHPNGALDTAYVTSLDGSTGGLLGLALQPDGHALVCNGLATVNGTTTSGLTRVLGEGTTGALSVPSSSQVQWLRGGTAPEAVSVVFELSTDGGETYATLGHGARISGGWELTGLNLPAAGIVRGRGMTTGGVQNGSGTQVMAAADLSTPAPEIIVRAGGSSITDGGTQHLGNVITGGTGSLTFTLQNVGLGTLSDVSVTKDGAHAGDFAITGSPSASVTGPFGSTTLSVQVSPSATGTRTATLHISSNDADESSFEIVLTVNGVDAFPGSVDPTFAPGGNFAVYGTAVQANGKILVAGDDDFSVSGVYTPNGRLNVDGTLDSSINPNGVGGDVFSVMAREDSHFVIGGNIDLIHGVTRNNIGLRVTGNGAADTLFNPNANDSVASMAPQADGKLWVCGWFTSIGGGSRSRLARLNADGTLDTSINPPAITAFATPRIYSVALQADGKILIVGEFTSVGGVARNRIARLNADGTLDVSFNPNANNTVYCVTVEPDGKILVGGLFAFVKSTARSRIARLNQDGTIDGGFNPGADSDVYSMVRQADGRLLVGGAFTTMGGVARNRIARLSAEGTVDGAFNPDANGQVNGLTLQADGKLLVAGGMQIIGGVARPYLARLINDAAVSSLAVPTPARVKWTRGGSSPEALFVKFELSTNGGTSYTALGQGTRLADGWELTGLALPATGHIRARAWTPGGRYNGSVGIVEIISAYTITEPEIALEQPAGTSLAHGSSRDFGAVPTGSSAPLSFVLRNTGTAPLTGLTITKDGAHADEFTITTSPAATVASGDSTTFLVQFAPAGTGQRTAVLHIASNDADENPFDIAVSGTGIVLMTADLASLTTSAGALTPVFGPQITSYTASVPFSTSSFTVTPTAAYSGATITVNGYPVTSGNASPTLSLSVGSNVITTLVTALDGVTTRTYTLTVTRAEAVPGTLDAGYIPNLDSRVNALAVQPDGRVLIGGMFTTVSGITRNRLARLNANGTLDLAFNPAPNNDVHLLALQADGKIIVAGNFSTIAGVSRSSLARLNADGSLDTGFSPAPNNLVHTVAVQQDGRILIGGDFTFIGAVARNRTARLNADGTLDTSFNPGADDTVYTIALQTDGKIIVGGNFSILGGAARTRLARLHADGTVDAAFNPGANNIVLAAAVQADGKILAGGAFTTLGGGTRSRLGRLNADGTLDTGFNLSVSSTVFNLLVQTDGRIVVGGSFATVEGVSRTNLARVEASGSLDTGFSPNPGNIVFASAMQADGRIIIGGDFVTVGGQTYPRLARLENNAATQSLAVTSSSLVRWLRGGASPETTQVTFELSTDGGATYAPLASGTRISGGWEAGGLSLPASGIVRARARLAGGDFNASSGLVETTASYALTSPEITLEHPAGTNLTDGGTGIDWGQVVAGTSGMVKTVTIRNTGTADLALDAFTKTGSQADDFTVSAPGSILLASGASTTFTITFTPNGTGMRDAILHLPSNDADENPFDVALMGTALDAQQAWRQLHFSTTVSSGPAADDADPDADGLVNALEFAINGHPWQPTSTNHVLYLADGQIEFLYQRASAASSLFSFQVEWSDTLVGPWSTTGVTQTTLNDNGITQSMKATLPAGTNGRRFVRLRLDSVSP